ncbi:lasso peptide biosynthesis PqqD family chaperone [Clostridium perfringens]|nr:lasso peptide biosynthesis PqqD family chaperone [Clostridium perfringens]
MGEKVLNLNSIIVQKEEVDVTELNGEKVMMDLDRGKYFMLNETGSTIWDAIDKKKSVSEIVDFVLENHEIERELCKNKVLEYLELLRHEELIYLK